MLAGIGFSEAQEAVEDAIVEEGLVLGPVSDFAAMLHNTAAAFGRPQAVYREARIYSFCSGKVAWQLAAERPENIVHCPLTLAAFTLVDDSDQTVHLAWRRIPGDSPGAGAARALLQRIADRVAAAGQRRPRSAQPLRKDAIIQ